MITPMESTVDYKYIDTPEALKKLPLAWADCKTIGIDFECENNLHHYGSYITLMQISTDKDNFIVDTVALKDITPILKMFENPAINKIFHDVSFDLRILHHQYNCRPKNVFDTELAARFAGEEDIGLGSLLAKYFDFDKQKKFQMANWTKRPLSQAMLAYAIQDASFLIRLKNLLIKKLQKLGRWTWVQEECRLLEVANLTHKEPTYMDIKGFRFLSDQQQTVLKYLFNLRDACAQKVNMPPYFIMSNKLLKELSSNPPKSINGWKNIKGTHPIVRSKARQFHEAVLKAKENILTLPRLVRPKRYSEKQKKLLNNLMALREKIAKKNNIAPYIIMNKDQLQQIVLTTSFDSLKNWQKNLVGDFSKVLKV